MGQNQSERRGAAGDKEGKPPPGTANARRASNAGGTPPIESSTAAGRASAARVQSRGCKGRSPLHKITLVSPFPTGEDRSASAGGGIGGRKASERRGRRATKKASPRRVPLTLTEPATPGGTPPIESSTAAGRASAARVQPGDARGEAPCIK